MNFFNYKNNELYAEGVSVKELSLKFGTPLYIYSYKTLKRHITAYKNAFSGIPHIICFALKSNSNSSIVNLIARQGGGADIVSGGELFRALKYGVLPEKIVYSGIGKTKKEIQYGLKNKILMFNVESMDELKDINDIARKMNVNAPIALRINPDIDSQTHPYISTGLKKNKFGIPIETALENYKFAKSLENIKIIGVHNHIGSQLTKVTPFVDAIKKMLDLIRVLSENNIEIKYLNIGGGLGITYKDEFPPDPQALAKNILPLIKDKGLTLIIEPGRSIVGNAGILITQVLYLKKNAKKNFIIVDAAMNDLIRPSIYNAYHHIQPIIRIRRKSIITDIVGPICESGDFLAKNREIQEIEKGEFLAVMSAGGYGFSMSSNYNSRPRAAEVMVKGKEFALIRKRETFNDLIKGEVVPMFI